MPGVGSIVALAVILTMIGVLLFGDKLPGVEKRVAEWFSSVTQRPRWFVLWWLVLPLWLVGRHYLLANHVPWFTPDTDNILAVTLWGFIPYSVENALKFTSARQMATLEQLLLAAQDVARKQNEIMEAIQADLDRSEERETLMLELIRKNISIIRASGRK